MLKDTGTVSFLLYGTFVAITIFAMVVSFIVIKRGEMPQEKLDKMIELFKYAIVTTAISTATVAISNLFKEREQDVKELEYFDKYVQDIKKLDGVQERLQLSKYLSIVAPSGEMKKSWIEYYDSVKIEYKEYLRLKKEVTILDTIKNPTYKQNLKKAEILEKITEKEAPIVSFKSTSPLDLEKAKIEEEKGFNFLMQKDVNNAINAFSASENAHNQYHSTYEISKYLRANRAKLLDQNSLDWQEANKKIANNFSYGMTPNIKSKLLEN